MLKISEKTLVEIRYLDSSINCFILKYPCGDTLHALRKVNKNRFYCHIFRCDSEQIITGNPNWIGGLHDATEGVHIPNSEEELKRILINVPEKYRDSIILCEQFKEIYDKATS